MARKKRDGINRSSGLDRSEAARFLAALDPDARFFTFQTFDDNYERGDRRLARVMHGSFFDWWDVLVTLNSAGAGIFVTINETDGRGRKAENVTRVRALFVDLDGGPLPQQGPTPTITVETSPGHWHNAYWRVTSVGLDEFSGRQRALIEMHGGDKAVCDLPRVMRLPGFYHCKGEPRLVSIASVSDSVYTAADFPAPVSNSNKPQQSSERHRPNATLTADEGRVARAVAFIANDNPDWHFWNRVAMALFAATWGSAAGFRIFDAWSRRWHGYSHNDTVERWRQLGRSPPNRIGAGTIFRLAGESCPRWADYLDDGDPEAWGTVAAFLAEVNA